MNIDNNSIETLSNRAGILGGITPMMKEENKVFINEFKDNILELTPEVKKEEYDEEYPSELSKTLSIASITHEDIIVIETDHINEDIAENITDGVSLSHIFLHFYTIYEDILTQVKIFS